jgi:hypothetical protein
MKRNKMRCIHLMKELMIIVFRVFITTSYSGLGPETIMISLLDISQPVGQNLNLKYWNILN